MAHSWTAHQGIGDIMSRNGFSHIPGSGGRALVRDGIGRDASEEVALHRSRQLAIENNAPVVLVIRTRTGAWYAKGFRGAVTEVYIRDSLRAAEVANKFRSRRYWLLVRK